MLIIRRRTLRWSAALAVAAVAPLAALVAACDDGGGTLTVYSGRSESLVGPLLDRFSDETGISVRVRYGDTAEFAATILEEGDNSPADVFFAQDAGALGAIDREGNLAPLPTDLLDLVPNRYRADDGRWVGISGRARTVVYNTERVSPDELPASILDFAEPHWRGRIGWVPTNGSFQAFVTALRLLRGDDVARAWLTGVQANDPVAYANNPAAVEAVGRGEVDVAFVNHYYVFRFIAEEGDDFAARNYFFERGDPGALVNVAGAGILETSDNKEDARRFIEYLLSDPAQRYFAGETFEYPLAAGVPADPALPPLEQLEPPDIDLSDLADLERTLDLLRETGVLP